MHWKKTKKWEIQKHAGIILGGSTEESTEENDFLKEHHACENS